MVTKIEKIEGKKADEKVIRAAGEILKNGGLVAFPTETVYGLGANALDEKAARKTYQAKGRPSDNPLIVHIARMEDLPAIVKKIPKKAAEAAEKFWPGPLTMIFEKSGIVPYGTTGGLDTVAVRMPDSETARRLILAGGGYISAPSANLSGRPSPTSAEHVREDLDGKIDMILDGGPVEIGVESTILDMTVDPPMILRPGAVTTDMLEPLIGPVSVDRTLIQPDSAVAPKAPGMKYRHYAPRANLQIIDGERKQTIAVINRLAEEKIKAGFLVGIIATEESVGRYECGNIKCVGSREDERTIAAGLYRILREFDEDGVDYIYSESFSEDGIGMAVMNRLLKAAGHQVIKAES